MTPIDFSFLFRIGNVVAGLSYIVLAIVLKRRLNARWFVFSIIAEHMEGELR